MNLSLRKILSDMSNFGMKEIAYRKFSFLFFRHYFSCFHGLVTIFLSSPYRLQRSKEIHPREVNVYDDGDDAKKTVGITTIFIEF
jgi:hypothetical protein